ncbi:hypothetical protein [uncultured Shimia sp.]|uniref:hypothetical protein n=1 Tax=uncultured Shimia sp. TaxID=573152 RepID=UPI002629F07F|nr:hypothetical protein [uncultured Shimia sp.]
MTNAPLTANTSDLPAGSMERLALFAEWTNTTPPERIMDGEGENRTFSQDILVYAKENGLSLDWFWMGNEMGLVMQAHYQARGTMQ